MPTIPILPVLALATAAAPAQEAWTQERLEAATREIQVQVEELRGAKFRRPVTVRLADTGVLREYVAQREAKMASPERLHRDECVAKLLGLVPPALDLRALELEIVEGQVGGFYDPTSDTFFLMDAMKGAAVKVILAHELTHALDDQLHDLDARLAAANEETDAELAIRCVVEGSGTNLMNRWTVAHGASIPPAEMAALQEMGAEALKKAPPVLWKPLVASYFVGDAFLARVNGLNLRLAGAAPADVDRAFREPPRSMEQVLNPERYWDAAKRDEPLRVAFADEATPAGWTRIGTDVLGEFGLALLAADPKGRRGLDLANPMSLLTTNWTNEPARGWGGDRLLLLARGDDRMIVLATVWDTPKDADQFEAAVRTTLPKPHAGARDAASGFVPRFTPTWWDVRRLERDGRGLVVVRVASTAQDDPDELLGVDPAFTIAAPAARSAEDGG